MCNSLSIHSMIETHKKEEKNDMRINADGGIRNRVKVMYPWSAHKNKQIAYYYCSHLIHATIQYFIMRASFL
jgi:hypothetical protein